MINLNFTIRNPWSNRFDNIRCWHGSTPFANKYWEIQLYKSTDVIDFSFHLTHRQSHAGLRLELGLFGYNADFNFYDNRHWDYETQSWND
jgi:hypothetical protein